MDVDLGLDIHLHFGIDLGMDVHLGSGIHMVCSMGTGMGTGIDRGLASGTGLGTEARAGTRVDVVSEARVRAGLASWTGEGMASGARDGACMGLNVDSGMDKVTILSSKVGAKENLISEE